LKINSLYLAALIALSINLGSCVWSSEDDSQSYLPLNDSEYPYADIPRIVIETESFRQIRDTETEIPARLQIYDGKSPISEVLPLTVKGRGNSSFNGMPKYSVKLKFHDEQSLFNIPPNKEWALIANFSDKSLLKNIISYRLYEKLGAKWSPKFQPVELYLNQSYMGVYLLIETVKVGESRVHIPTNNSSFLVEFDKNYKPSDFIIQVNNTPFRIHYPKDSSNISHLENFLKQFYNFLESESINDFSSLSKYFNVNEYKAFFWTYEFGSTFDCFRTSTFFTWTIGGSIAMGPVWDFDLAYGDPLHNASPEGWRIKEIEWNQFLFKNADFRTAMRDYWINQHKAFEDIRDSLPIYGKNLEKAAKNNFRRWPILESTENWTHITKYNSYEEAVQHLQKWISDRMDWIDIAILKL